MKYGGNYCSCVCVCVSFIQKFKDKTLQIWYTVYVKCEKVFKVNKKDFFLVSNQARLKLFVAQQDIPVWWRVPFLNLNKFSLNTSIVFLTIFERIFGNIIFVLKKTLTWFNLISIDSLFVFVFIDFCLYVNKDATK